MTKKFVFDDKISFLEILQKEHDDGKVTYHYYKYDEEYLGDHSKMGPLRQFNKVTSTDYTRVSEAVTAGYQQIDGH